VRPSEDAEGDGRLPGVASRQQSCSRKRADGDAGQHRPKPMRQPPETWPRRQLPDIGDEGRHDQERGGFCWGHHEREQAHRDSRQPKPNHPLDEARKKEGDGCDDEGKRLN
jgi:hypothetical protein